jgi:hypothetical protein
LRDSTERGRYKQVNILEDQGGSVAELEAIPPKVPKIGCSNLCSADYSN